MAKRKQKSYEDIVRNAMNHILAKYLLESGSVTSNDDHADLIYSAEQAINELKSEVSGMLEPDPAGEAIEDVLSMLDGIEDADTIVKIITKGS